MIKQYLEKRYKLHFFNKTVLEKIKRKKGNANNDQHFNSILTIDNLQELIYKINYIYRQSKETRKTKDKSNSLFCNIDYEDIEKDLHNYKLYDFYNEDMQRMVFIDIKPEAYKLLKHLFFEN